MSISRRCVICSDVNPCGSHSDEAQSAELRRNCAEFERITRAKNLASVAQPPHPEKDMK